MSLRWLSEGHCRGGRKVIGSHLGTSEEFSEIYVSALLGITASTVVALEEPAERHTAVRDIGPGSLRYFAENLGKLKVYQWSTGTKSMDLG
jgi:hypothetical protein